VTIALTGSNPDGSGGKGFEGGRRKKWKGRRRKGKGDEGGQISRHWKILDRVPRIEVVYREGAMGGGGGGRVE